MSRKDIYGYMFKEQNGKIELISKAKINPYNIEKILGQTKVKGKHQMYEYVYLKSRNFEGVLLIERKALNYDIVSHFIQCYSSGFRSVENHPYTLDLKDSNLFDDLGITVLTYKYFYICNGLRTCYYPCKKSDVSEELIEKLQKYTMTAIEEKEKYVKTKDKKRNELVFMPC